MDCIDDAREFFRDREYEPISFKFKLVHEAFVAVFNKQLRDDDMTFSQLMVITYLDGNREKKVTQKDVSEALHIKHPTTIGLIKRLVEKEMIQVVTDSENRKYRNITLTEKGLEFIERNKERRHHTDNYLVSGFSDDEILQLRGYLDRIIDNLKSLS